MEQNKKDFDAVAFMMQQRERLTEQLAKMTSEEIIAYFMQVKARGKAMPNA
jgi:hypothetical protein